MDMFQEFETDEIVVLANRSRGLREALRILQTRDESKFLQDRVRGLKRIADDALVGRVRGMVAPNGDEKDW